jgi:hypothetical protein
MPRIPGTTAGSGLAAGQLAERQLREDKKGRRADEKAQRIRQIIAGVSAAGQLGTNIGGLVERGRANRAGEALEGQRQGLMSRISSDRQAQRRAELEELKRASGVSEALGADKFAEAKRATGAREAQAADTFAELKRAAGVSEGQAERGLIQEEARQKDIILDRNLAAIQQRLQREQLPIQRRLESMKAATQADVGDLRLIREQRIAEEIRRQERREDQAREDAATEAVLQQREAEAAADAALKRELQTERIESQETIAGARPTEAEQAMAALIIGSPLASVPEQMQAMSGQLSPEATQQAVLRDLFSGRVEARTEGKTGGGPFDPTKLAQLDPEAKRARVAQLVTVLLSEGFDENTTGLLMDQILKATEVPEQPGEFADILFNVSRPLGAFSRQAYELAGNPFATPNRFVRKRFQDPAIEEVLERLRSRRTQPLTPEEGRRFQRETIDQPGALTRLRQMIGL